MLSSYILILKMRNNILNVRKENNKEKKNL